MVVPPPIAAPWTAATNGLSKLTNAFIRRDCGDSPGPGGFFRKSSISLPAQNESPAPCQMTTRVFSSFAASLKMSASATYIADVIAFRFAGRFNWTRSILPVRSVTMSSVIDVMSFAGFRHKSRFGMAPGARGSIVMLGYFFQCFGNGTAFTQTVDFGGAKSELLENLLVVFSKLWGALRGYLGDAMHLHRTADRRCQLAAGAFERNDNVIRSQLGIIDHFLRPAHCSKRHMNAVEHFVPMRHRLGAEDLVQDCRELRHIRRQLSWIREARVGQNIRAADCFGDGHQLIGRHDENKPGVVFGAIHIHCRVCGVRSIVQAEEFRLTQRGLDGNAGGPYAFRKKRSRDVRALTGTLAAIKRRDNRRIESDGGGIVSAAGHWPGRRRTGIACHRQQ